MSKGKLKKHPYKPKARTQPPSDPSAGQGEPVAGLAWYTPESYARLLQLSVDAGERDPTYEQWLDNASNALINFQIMGIPIQKVLVDVDQLTKWCRAQGAPINRHACSEYVSYLLSNGKAEFIS